MVRARGVTFVGRTFVVVTFACASCACTGRVIYDDVDTGADDADVADTIDAAPEIHYDAQIYPSTPPPPGTYSAGGGICPYVACGPNSICDEVSGWCCGGRWAKGACKCGDEDGCAPPAVCCPIDGGGAHCVASVAACPGAR